ncbi:phospholipid scramblase 1 [Nowakowskiella sp. JEL0078]|nr:phospholipid scramblase 1 [Nowakowskiella sp. JEL0078]
MRDTFAVEKTQRLSGTYDSELTFQERSPLRSFSANTLPRSAASSPALTRPGSTHYTDANETKAFCEWINLQLHNDLDVRHLIPIVPNETALFESLHDGILLCKLLNVSSPNAIDLTLIRRNPKTNFQIIENHSILLSACKKLGIEVHNIGPQDLESGVPHLCLGVIWQIIKLGLSRRVKNILSTQSDALTSSENNTFGNTSIEQSLIIWINSQIPSTFKRVKNLGHDLTDSTVYAHILLLIASKNNNQHISNSPNLVCISNEPDFRNRANIIVESACALGCQLPLFPEDIQLGNTHLNIVFVTMLYEMFHQTSKNSPKNEITRNCSVSEKRKKLKNEEGENLRNILTLGVKVDNFSESKILEDQLIEIKQKVDTTAENVISLTDETKLLKRLLSSALDSNSFIQFQNSEQELKPPIEKICIVNLQKRTCKNPKCSEIIENKDKEILMLRNELDITLQFLQEQQQIMHDRLNEAAEVLEKSTSERIRLSTCVKDLASTISQKDSIILSLKETLNENRRNDDTASNKGWSTGASGSDVSQTDPVSELNGRLSVIFKRPSVLIQRKSSVRSPFRPSISISRPMSMAFPSSPTLSSQLPVVLQTAQNDQWHPSLEKSSTSSPETSNSNRISSFSDLNAMLIIEKIGKINSDMREMRFQLAAKKNSTDNVL